MIEPQLLGIAVVEILYILNRYLIVGTHLQELVLIALGNQVVTVVLSLSIELVNIRKIAHALFVHDMLVDPAIDILIDEGSTISSSQSHRSLHPEFAYREDGVAHLSHNLRFRHIALA